MSLLHAPRSGRLAAMILAFCSLGTWAAPALGHEIHEASDQALLSTWPLSFDIVLPLALAMLIYARGLFRARAAQVPWHRHALFFAGIAALFVALQSPVDPLAERLFWVHQVQHLLLRMLAPMLLVLAWPQAGMTSGLPANARRMALAPLLSNRPLQSVFAFLTHPVPATLLFVGTLYVWQVPALHNFALENEPVHYLMHVTMLLAGLVFFWRIFDQRPAGKGARYGTRLMMLWVAVLSNIALGAFTSLKDKVLYTAYDRPPGRLFDMPALSDERIGGIIIWIPSSMMVLVALIIVVRMLGRHEARAETQRIAAQSGRSGAASHVPTTAAAMIAQARQRNRALALGFGLFVVTVFASAVLVGILAEYAHRADPIQVAGAPAHHLSAPYAAQPLAVR